jgi:hypothetical protein
MIWSIDYASRDLRQAQCYSKPFIPYLAGAIVCNCQLPDTTYLNIYAAQCRRFMRALRVLLIECLTAPAPLIVLNKQSDGPRDLGMDV